MVKSHLLFFCFIQLLFVHAIEYGFDCDGTTITVREISESAGGVAELHHITFGPKTHPNIEISKTNDEGRIEVLQYHYRASLREVHWVLGKGGIRTEVYIPMVYCGYMANVINYALKDDSVVRISIGPHVLKGAHVIDEHIPNFINVIDLKAHGVVFKFRDVDGKYRQLKFEPNEDDRRVIMIGTKSCCLITLADETIPIWRCSEPGELVPTIGFTPTDELRGEILGRIHSHVAITIGQYTIQTESPHICGVRTTPEFKVVKSKVSKHKAVVHKKKKKEISYNHCSIQLPEPKNAHVENPYIMIWPNPKIVEIIRNAFPTHHMTELDIYDYAIKDMTVFGQQQYLEFISVMDNFDAIIKKYDAFWKKVSFGKKCTPEMAMMKIYKIYIETSRVIEFDDWTIDRKLRDAAANNFVTEETHTKIGAWKEATDDVYGKIKKYFDTCIPLSSPHTINTRVQQTPTATLAGYITEKFELKTDENIQKMYDVLIEMCRSMCVCENYEFISAMQYLKDIYEEYKDCNTEMMHVYRAYINMGTDGDKINIPGKDRVEIESAATDFTTTETNPNIGIWETIETHIYKLINTNFDPEVRRVLKERYDESGAKESYYNELTNRNSNTYNGYDHSNSNNYNGGNRNSNFNLMNPILMLTGLIFCLCFICAALLNVISCGCCYVFGRYQTKISDDKTENDYEYNNNI